LVGWLVVGLAGGVVWLVGLVGSLPLPPVDVTGCVRGLFGVTDSVLGGMPYL